MNIWAITDGSAGHRNQAEGLAQALAKYCHAKYHHVTTQPSNFSRLLPVSLGANLININLLKLPEPPPQIIICCGTKSQSTAYRLATLFSAITICIQRPTTQVFDIIVAPEHDYNEKEKRNSDPNKLFTTIGSIGKVSHSITLTESQTILYNQFSALKKPLIGVLIGGSNKAFAIDPKILTHQLQTIAEKSGGTLLITPSRRTDAATKDTLRKMFSPQHYMWDEHNTNPYSAILKCADTLVVTWDSVNMLSEACTLGKPVYALKLPAKAKITTGKFHSFYQSLIAGNYMQIFNGDWAPKQGPSLNETDRVAKLISSVVVSKI